VGSSNQNETRNEHRHRDMPPLGPMHFLKRVSEEIVAWGYFLLELGFVQVPRNLLLPGHKLPLHT